MVAGAPVLVRGVPERRLVAARTSVAWVFAGNGFAFASLFARMPAIRDLLGVSPGELGLLILAVSAGAVTALPTAGAVVRLLRPAGTVLVGMLFMCTGLAVVATVMSPGVPFGVGLFAIGMGSGTWDVAMNVEAADVEKRLGRPIMPRFHAGWSLGSVAGAGCGALVAAAGMGVTPHLLLATALVGCVVVVSVRRFLSAPRLLATLRLPRALSLSSTPSALSTPSTRPGPEREDAVPDGRAAESAGTDREDASWSGAGAPDGSDGGLLSAWRERRTLLVGLLALGMGFAEGSANDWLAVGIVDGYGVEHAVGAAGFGVFVAAMTAGRLAGTPALERFGRVRALRGSALLVLAGVILVVSGSAVSDRTLAAGLAVGALGAVVWGVGASLGFPVAMSAAADEQDRAAARLSVVATLGYTAFLAGPPLLGRLADHVGVIPALLAVSGAVLLSLVVAGAARPPVRG